MTPAKHTTPHNALERVAWGVALSYRVKARHGVHGERLRYALFCAANRKPLKGFSSSATKRARRRGEFEGGTVKPVNTLRRAAAKNRGRFSFRTPHFTGGTWDVKD